jgi:hypothetical protein
MLCKKYYLLIGIFCLLVIISYFLINSENFTLLNTEIFKKIRKDEEILLNPQIFKENRKDEETLRYCKVCSPDDKCMRTYKFDYWNEDDTCIFRTNETPVNVNNICTTNGIIVNNRYCSNIIYKPVRRMKT